MKSLSDAILRLKNGVVVSCQAPEGDPFRSSEAMAQFAVAAVDGGAAGIRAAVRSRRNPGGYSLADPAEQFRRANYLNAERPPKPQKVFVVSDDVASMCCERAGKVRIILRIAAPLFPQGRGLK